MDLRFTDEELAFRDEVRNFMRTKLPDKTRQKIIDGRHLDKDDIVTWQRILNAKGWAVANWPVEWGGTGWTPVQQYMFQEELQMTALCFLYFVSVDELISRKLAEQFVQFISTSSVKAQERFIYQTSQRLQGSPGDLLGRFGVNAAAKDR